MSLSINRNTKHDQSGLTLVEMLVVLVIVALVSTLLVQGLGNALSLYSRVQIKQKQSFSESILHRWWRDTVSAAAPNRLHKQDFQGQVYRLQMQTFKPLLSEDGILNQIEWAISDSQPYSLIYKELSGLQEQELTLPLRTSQRPLFTYVDNTGQARRSWPIDEYGNNLPEAVRLSLGHEDLHAIIRSHKDQLFYIDEVEFGRGN